VRLIILKFFTIQDYVLVVIYQLFDNVAVDNW
jgi:hypothetical protein